MKTDPAPKGAESYYEASKKVYPKEIKGRFQRLRTLAVFALLGLYYLLPWVNWGDHQALLFDLPARKFYIFGLTFWPQDFYLMAWLLIIAAVSLFFFTALAGRLWCGYACPQTVWTEVFLWMEHWTEGDRRHRMKLDKAPWGREKILRKGSKQLLWISFAAWTGFTFVGFFTPIDELGARLLTLDLGRWETFWIIFYSFATYGNAGYMREQVCKYMCPYARFQSAMFDRDTLVISYDVERGEPRGSRKRGIDYKTQGLGDCIDCTLCVQVCPTGIDIREGLQIDCIACAACVDACDEVMDKVGYSRGLVRYTTENALEKKETWVLRPRLIVYGVILMALIAGFAYAVGHRMPLVLDVIRDRNALYRMTNHGMIENVYTLKIMNMDTAAHRYTLEVDGLSGIHLDLDTDNITVESGEVATLAARVRVPENGMTESGNTITLTLRATDRPDLKISEPTRFIGPAPRR
ncbi:MAG: cytochrome c oxidase accessory protein CcoG [Gammaproteobacteria bacterium]|jgi:cytochrome c oxidase accessory protein FixG|nr:cytochrome c oxidase accessory protein CcoG [Gammaproteobacteria bacterium]